VSRVVNANPRVKGHARSRVERAIAELRYFPDRRARGLRRGGAQVLAVVVPDVRNPFYPSVVRGIEDVASERGYPLTLCNTDDNPLRERLYADIVREERVAGVILASTCEVDASARLLAEAGIPVVAIDRRPAASFVDSVVVDNERGTAEAVRHLASEGFHRIAVIAGPAHLSTGQERLAGFRQGLTAAGLPDRPEYVKVGDFRPSSGERAMEELLALTAGPDAVLVCNNLMTIGALRVLRRRGVAIPAEMGIVGFDDGDWAELLTPPLTAVVQPTYEIGTCAAQALFERIDQIGGSAGDPAREIVLPLRLVVRGSSLRAAQPPHY